MVDIFFVGTSNGFTVGMRDGGAEGRSKSAAFVCFLGVVGVIGDTSEGIDG